MKLERPGDRIWHMILLLVAFGFCVFELLSDNEILDGVCVLIEIVLITVSITVTVISFCDDNLFDAAKQKSREAVQEVEKEASALRTEKIHLECQVESQTVELQHLKEMNNSLLDEVKDLQRDNATLQRENIDLILKSAQRISELNCRITELKLKEGGSVC